MKLIVSGRIVSDKDQKGIFGTSVEVYSEDPASEQREPLQSQITNRNGEFSFRLREKALARLGDIPKTLFLRALDAKTQVLSQSGPMAIAPDQPLLVELVVDVDRLTEAVLPPQRVTETLVPVAVFDAVDRAIQTVVCADEIEGQRLAIRGFYCALPPILDLEDILDVAQGVLRGQPEDMRSFQDHLDNMEIWNLSNNPAPRPQLSAEQADFLLSDEFLDDYRKKREATRHPGSRESIVPIEKGVTLLVATMRVSGSSPAQIHHNIGILSEQFCGLHGLDRLHQAALGALSGGLAERVFFLRTLNFMGGFCGPGARPGPFPPRPSPIPCGRPPWPPDPDGYHTPFPPIIEDCTPEAIRGFREFLERGVAYTIESVTPNNACPGQEITIRGSNFEFHGRSGHVLFSGHSRGTKVRAVPTFYSTTEIRVVVPEGATCGDLELEIPDALAATVTACDATVDLFYGPTVPFHFAGGATQITLFRLLDETRCHFDSSGVVDFIWATCNADAVTLTLRLSAGAVLAEFAGLRADGRPFQASLPAFNTSAFIDAELIAHGPCGEDRETRRFFVRRTLPDASQLTLLEDCFRNWHGNIRRTVTVAAPTTLDEIVDVVHAAGQASKRLGLIGSRWSYSNCVTDTDGSCQPRVQTGADAPIWLMATDCSFEREDGSVDFADSEISTVIPYALRADARTVLSGDLLSEFTPAPAATSPILPEAPCTPPANRFVHVKAGIKLAHLNCLLDQKCLAMATLGGSNGQSLAGAISTGTHGTNVRLPPIQDFVRAIHLVGPGGKQWWIEPESDPVTDRSRMRELMASQVLDPCLELVYDDRLFNACLVSVGAAGVFYSVILEAAPKHHLRSTTERISFAQARSTISDEVLGPRPPFFAEFVLGPNDVVHYTTRQPAHPADEQDFVGEHHGFRVTMTAWLATQVVTRVMPALPEYIAQLGALLSSPLGLIFFDVIRRQIRFLENLLNLLAAPIQILQDIHNSEEVWVDTAVTILNLIWDIQTPTVNGREIVEAFHNNFIADLRPPGTRTKNSFAITNDQTGCQAMRHNAFERRIESYEYIMDAGEVVPFLERMRALAEQVKGEAPLILTINVRFTQRTRALLGMQQFEPTGYVELWTVRGISGSEEFARRLEELTSDMHVIPHWGHYHRRFPGGRAKNFSRVYPLLDVWSAQMDHLARGADSDPNTFRLQFVRDRGLLRDL